MLGSQPQSQPPSSAAAHYGAASIALGTVFLLLAPPALTLAFWLEATGYKGFSASDKSLAALGGYGTVIAILALSAVGVVFGARGISAARWSRQPAALGVAGVLLNGLALAVWVGTGVAWHSQAWRLL